MEIVYYGSTGIPDPYGTLRLYLSKLDQMEHVESWDEIFADILSPGFSDPYHFSEELLVRTVRCLLGKLLSSRCPHKEAAHKVIEMAGVYLDACRLPYTVKPCYILEPLCEKFRYDEMNMNAAETAMSLVDPQLLRVIISYGRCKQSTEICHGYFGWMWLRLFQQQQAQGEVIYQELFQSGGRMSSRNQRGFRRIPLISQALVATLWALKIRGNTKEIGSVLSHDKSKTMYGGGTKMEAYACMQQAYVDTLPDPLVSAEELWEFLQLAIGKDKPEEVDRIVREFVDLHGQQVYKPRRLQQLSRCKIREVILKNAPVTLPVAVGQLPLPNALKDLILCSWPLSTYTAVVRRTPKSEFDFQSQKEEIVTDYVRL